MKRYLLGVIFLVGLMGGAGDRVWGACPPDMTISGTFSICAGATTTLTDAATGGTWTSSAMAAATIGFFSGVVTSGSPGTATITYTYSPGCTSTIVVTVNALPTTIAGTTTVCQGATTGLTDGTTGGTWGSDNTSAATVGSVTGVVTGVGPGTATITYTLSTGCGSTTTIVTVNLLPGPIGGTLAVCQGSTTTLTDGATGGTWSSSSVNVTIGPSSGVATASETLSTGTAYTTIYYMAPNGCSTNATMTVNPLPAINSSPSSVCAGATVTLTLAPSSPSGGTWSSSTTTVATIGSGNGHTFGVAAGTTSIIYTLSTACADTTTITVNPQPVAGTISGTATVVCAGSTISLTDGATGGNWSSSNTFRATVDNFGNVSGLTAGTTTISYTVINTCNTVAATQVVTVNPSPGAGTINGTATVCAGATTSLTDAASGGVWSSTVTGIATVSLGTVGGVTAGTSIISYTVTNSCGMVAATRVVTVNPLPAPGVITGTASVCAGLTTSLTDAATGGAWTSTALGTATVSGGTVGGVAAGTATISYTVNITCGIAAATRVVTVNPLPSAVTVTGGGNFCGSSITINASNGSSGTIYYQGTTFDGTSTGAPSPSESVTATGTYYFRAESAAGCWGLQGSTTVTINPVPSLASASNDGPICAGATLHLTANAPSGVTGYSWSGPVAITGASSGSASVPEATTAASGTYTVTVNNGSGTGCTATYSTPATVKAAPTLSNATNNGPICAGATLLLTANSPLNVAGYSWSGPSAITGGTSGSASVPGATTGASGTYSVTVNNGAGTGCTATYSTPATVKPGPTLANATNNGPICAGVTLTLTANSPSNVTGYTWSGPVSVTGATSASGSVPAATTAAGGTYSVTVNNGGGSGCTTTYTTSATVKPAPSLTNATNNGPICAGATLQLTANSPLNITDYSWSGPVSITGATSGAASVPGATTAASGTYTVTVDNGTGAGCTATYTTLVTVNPLPAITATATPTPVCAGNNLTLNSTASGGTSPYATYTWSGPGSFTASVQNTGIFGISASGAGVYSVSVTDSKGCTSASPGITANVFVNPLPAQPAITTVPPSTLCLNTMYQNFGASASAPSGTVYNWTASTGTVVWAQDVASHQNCLVNFTAGGSATITLTDSNITTHCISRAQTTINVTSAEPSQPDTVIYFESNLICLQRGVTYLWGYDDSATLVSNTLCGADSNQSYSFDCTSPDFVNNVYWVKTTSGGCFEKSYYHVPPNNKGINNNTNTNNGGLGEMKVYPNPAGNYIYVQFDNLENNVTLKVSDIMGREVMILPVQDVKTNIDLSGLRPSIYLLECYLNGVKVASSKFEKN